MRPPARSKAYAEMMSGMNFMALSILVSGTYVRRRAPKDLDYEFVDFRSTLASGGCG